MDAARGYDQSKIDLLKATYAKGATDTELQLFLTVAQHRGLDPFSGQIVFVKRKQFVDGEYKEVGTFQVTIDGFRAIADRTGQYMPSENLPVFTYKKDGTLESAIVEALKWHEKSQQWMRVKAVARYDEFVQMTRDGKPNHMWAKMPHNQLAKCAEAQLFRKTWPQQTEGLEVEGVEALPPGAIEGQYTAITEGKAPASSALPATTQPTQLDIARARVQEIATRLTGQTREEAEAELAAHEAETIPAGHDERLAFIAAHCADINWTPRDVSKYVKDTFMHSNPSQCTDDELLTLCKMVTTKPATDNDTTGAGK